MRESVAARAFDWMSGLVDLMQHASPTMPVRPMLTLLGRTFDHTGVSWNWSEPDGRFGMIMNPYEALLAEGDTLDAWLTGEFLECHALTTWFTTTQDPAPYTLARVPVQMVPWRRRVVVEQPLRRLDLHHQLSIVYRLRGPNHYAFVIGRGTRDFDDDDLEVARCVRQSVRSLDHQCAAVRRLLSGIGSTSLGDGLGLSGRELAVLQLLSEGHSTRSIARQLGCTPRTIEKHLERIFRKLGVKDRLNAVREARLAGVLAVEAVAQRPAENGRLGPGEFRGPLPHPAHSR